MPFQWRFSYRNKKWNIIEMACGALFTFDSFCYQQQQVQPWQNDKNNRNETQNDIFENWRHHIWYHAIICRLLPGISVHQNWENTYFLTNTGSRKITDSKRRCLIRFILHDTLENWMRSNADQLCTKLCKSSGVLEWIDCSRVLRSDYIGAH